MDSQAAARDAGLRYVEDRRPGITRRRRGRHFAYFYPDGSSVRDDAELTRIKALAIPPAYECVWISPIPNGHIQATGRDAKGRKQYRYHKRWREVRDEAKYNRLVAFGKALPEVRKTIAKDLAAPELSRRKVLAAVVALLDMTGIRVGNEEYAEANGSYGLTTLRTRHVSLQARIIKRCRDLSGEELFDYVEDDGTVRSVGSDDVNDYIREIAGEDFSAKDFRTWIGTVECIAALVEPAAHVAEAKKNLNDALARVAARLGNTPAICRKAYVHPAVIETYTSELRLPALNGVAERHTRGLDARERFALKFVQRWERFATRRQPARRKAVRGEIVGLAG